MTGEVDTEQGVTECLSEEEVVAFATGQATSAERDRTHRHLDVCGPCQQLLSEAVGALATAQTAGPGEAVGEDVPWSTSFRPGMLVGHRYVIRRFIARGGMGEVYEAFDQDLQERVALKTVMSTASDDPSAVRRLKAEVQLARRVSHPNVCRIYDFGTHRTSGAPISFLTMEFVEGETLGVRLRRGGALPLAEALELGRALLKGLAAAHAAGVLHRDFKSDNVLLRKNGERVDPLILDFGLARALDHRAGQSSAHDSASGHGLVGTLAYLAPEQLEGQPYTKASDIYSFGLVWFEMLTGELPFKARSSPAVTTLERLLKPVPPPSLTNPAVPSALDAVVLSCLARSPRERLGTATAVLDRLDQLEQPLLVVAPRRWVASLPLVASLAVGVAVAGLALEPRLNLARLPVPTARPPAVPARTSPNGTGPAAAPHPLQGAPAATSSGTPQKPSKGVASTKPTWMRQVVGARLSDAVPREQSARPLAATLTGWENPFARPTPSGEPSAVLDEPADRRAPPRDAELAEGHSQLIGDGSR